MKNAIAVYLKPTKGEMESRAPNRARLLKHSPWRANIGTAAAALAKPALSDVKQIPREEAGYPTQFNNAANRWIDIQFVADLRRYEVLGTRAKLGETLWLSYTKKLFGCLQQPSKNNSTKAANRASIPHNNLGSS